ncbi:hypothetical protein ACHAXM_010220 [Skeletonema potamos]
MKVSEYMSTITEIATPDTPLSQIAKQLATNNVSCVVIIEDKKPVGIITKTDITRAFAEEVPSSTIAEAFMSSKDLICVRTDTQTDDIADLIQKKFVHHLVVVDDKGVFAGVASSWDVAREVSLDAKAFPYNRELWTKPKKVIARSTDKAPVMQ